MRAVTFSENFSFSPGSAICSTCLTICWL
ncbi:hypothetical protein [Spirosoma sp.]